MQPVTVGMTVFSLDDRTVGVVTAVNNCCFRFAVEGQLCDVSARWDGVFDIQGRCVSLIYVYSEPHRYACAAHPVPLVPAITPRSIGWAVGTGPRSGHRVLRPATERQRPLVA